MKKHLFVILAVVSMTACKFGDRKSDMTQPNPEATKALKDSSNYTTIQWLDSTYKDFAKINEGQILEVSFKFKNIGKKRLFIQNASASCGCTVVEKPEAPIEPGEEGEIKAKFDSHNRTGEQHKEIYVTSNTNPNTSTLDFRVEVIKNN